MASKIQRVFAIIGAASLVALGWSRDRAGIVSRRETA